ncbi:MAG TPA: DUF1003 domain-containing protein [Vicinamibacterales bacterium]|nr:DUF1003 domain-containing protein [Vicinamibacterales bacterium]
MKQSHMITPGDPTLENVRAISDMERRVVHDRSVVERITDRISDATGSMSFVVLHTVAFGAWISMNMRKAWSFDPYPFTLLNLAVSLEAIVLTSIVLMAQNRMARQADKRAHLDLQVNLLAEQELTAILRMVHALCQHTGMPVGLTDERLAHLLKDTDIERLAGALDHHLPMETGSPPEQRIIATDTSE